ncbi:DMT family transporter [Acidimicrobiia bacterium]|jgi:drug/metabolite transporter (DMT)-like permease|nr:DMT family transporter [Acidimicrobiia bacterium]MDA9645741.1 DMT family transporter [Candidatus Actinomarina sp.]MDC1071142.1 DMT family transporter [Acidimicrobiia bacterium]|tara:strand:- start:3730 stop:4557 length:828 start_codon:yes stop_codon:yes gene_type:complete
MIKNKKTLAISSLVLSAIFFGGTFIVVKNLLDDFSPINIVFLRYAVATILFLFSGGIPTKKTVKPGLLMGVFLWVGYVTQTQGLLTTSTINSGVVTGFYIVLTPIFSKIINKTSLSGKSYLFSLTGFLGIFLIASNSYDQLFGNLFTLICATGYALHIVMVERYIKNQNISQLMFVQSLIGTLLCVPFLNLEQFSFKIQYVMPILFLGFVVNFAAFYLQLYGQKIINASTAALLLSLEAIFALIIGILYVGEVLNITNWAGVFLVLLSIFLVIKE